MEMESSRHLCRGRWYFWPINMAGPGLACAVRDGIHPIRISRMSVLVHAQATSQAKPSVNKSTIKDHAAHTKSYEYIEKRRL